MRYIDADKLRKDVLDMPNCYNGFSDTYDKAMIIDLIDEQPTVDIDAITASHEQIGFDKGYREGYAQATSEVRHGHWNERYDTRYHFECSICKYLHQYKDNYCPLCGAKMDGERREDAETN